MTVQNVNHAKNVDDSVDSIQNPSNQHFDIVHSYILYIDKESVRFIEMKFLCFVKRLKTNPRCSLDHWYLKSY